MEPGRKKGVVIFAVSCLVTLLFAQACSFVVEHYLDEGNSVQVLSFVYFTHVRNMGGIFGLMQGKGWMFTVMSILVLGGLLAYILRFEGIRNYEYFCYGLIAGGGMSNITDRLVYGSVIDFIDVRGISFWNYIFNTADVMIHAGIWPLLVISLYQIRKQRQQQKLAAPI